METFPGKGQNQPVAENSVAENSVAENSVAENCHWQEVPQVPFLSRQKFYCDRHMFVTTKVCLL